jgi:hypothetical protein
MLEDICAYSGSTDISSRCTQYEKLTKQVNFIFLPPPPSYLFTVMPQVMNNFADLLLYDLLSDPPLQLLLLLSKIGAVLAVIVWLLDLQLPIKSVSPLML